MSVTWDPVVVVNLILSAAILVIGFLGWQRSGSGIPLEIGIAFGLFGFSHLMTLLGLADSLQWVLIVVRTVAYLIVLFSVYQMAYRVKPRVGLN